MPFGVSTASAAASRSREALIASRRAVPRCMASLVSVVVSRGDRRVTVETPVKKMKALSRGSRNEMPSESTIGTLQASSHPASEEMACALDMAAKVRGKIAFIWAGGMRVSDCSQAPSKSGGPSHRSGDLISSSRPSARSSVFIW